MFQIGYFGTYQKSQAIRVFAEFRAAKYIVKFSCRPLGRFEVYAFRKS